MAYRKFDTNTWADKRFEALEPMERYLFIYLWTNDRCNQAGMYEITPRRITFDTKISTKDLDGLLKNLEPLVEYYFDREVVWVKNFLKRQCQNKEFAKSALGIVAEQFPEKFDEFVWVNQKLILKYQLVQSSYLEKAFNPPSTPLKETSNRSSQAPEAEAGTEADAEAGAEADAEAKSVWFCGQGGGGNTDSKPDPIKKIIEIWNEAVERNQSTMPQLMAINSGTTRHTHVRARWKEHPDLATWKEIAEKATASDFMNGRVKNRNRPLGFDWIVQSAGNLTKVLEGKYDNAPAENNAFSSNGDTPETNPYMMEKYKQYDEIGEVFNV